ncbi:MAG: MFS transporter [Ethanoligenens sp.]
MENEKIGFRERFGYGVGDWAHNLGYASFGWFMVIYYTQVLKISAGAAAVVTLLAMFVGGLADIAAGVAVDKTRSRFGKARPWILRMMIPYAVFLALMFSVPDIGMMPKMIWAFATLLIFNVVYSFINSPYGILNSLITHNQYERSVINLFRTFLAYGSAIMVSCATPFIVKAFGGSYTGWSRTGITYGSIAVLLFLMVFFFTKERVDLPGAQQAGMSLKQSFQTLLKNDNWLFIITFGAVFFFFYVSNCSTTILYVSYVVGVSAKMQQTLNIVVALGFYIPIMIGTLIQSRLIVRFGKRNLCIAGVLVIILGAIVMMVQPSNVVLLIVGSIIKGFGMSPVMGCYYAMATDTIEYGEWKTGVRIEGLTYSTSSFTAKIGSGLGTAAVSIALAVSGYSAQAHTQSHSTSLAIQFMYLILPIIASLLMLLLLSKYKLDHIYKKVEQDLALRHHAPSAQEPAADDTVTGSTTPKIAAN